MADRINKIDNLEISLNLAEKIGLNESIMLMQLAKCIETSGLLLEGERWVSMTYVQWQEFFPFWSTSTIKRILLSLQKMGLIKIEQHSKHRYDRTNWYCIYNEKQKEFVPNKNKQENNVKQSAEMKIHHTTKTMTPEVEHKYRKIEKRLRDLSFYPLKKHQKEELKEVCQSFSLTQIETVIEQTAERSIYAWKYAYKVLIANQSTPRINKQSFRKIIRTEKLPDWFGKEDKNYDDFDEEMLAKKKRLEAIQAKYRERELSSSLG